MNEDELDLAKLQARLDVAAEKFDRDKTVFDHIKEADQPFSSNHDWHSLVQEMMNKRNAFVLTRNKMLGQWELTGEDNDD